MPGRTLHAGAAALSDKVTTQVPRIFEQAQTSIANHQKNLVALHKLQTEAAQCTEEVRKGRGVRLVGEKIFEEAILNILTRVLPLKKGVTPADRVVKFIGGYVKFVNEKGTHFTCMSAKRGSSACSTRATKPRGSRRG